MRYKSLHQIRCEVPFWLKVVVLKYRAEVDGLRAFAVLPVIFFHAGFELFQGGFVGVDVFFVISGYLITNILVADIESNKFSIVNFYERRARRILPALFVVMLVCIPFAYVWMTPTQMKEFALSLVAVSLFSSNVLFWLESDYFAAAAEKKPLLHTWSLSVEEQFYVFFPVFLFLAWRFGRNRVFWMIVVFALLSLVLSEWGWRNKASANFFLTPTRVWELFAGAIAALVERRRGPQSNNLLAMIGLVCVIVSVFAYDKNTPFPSVYTLLPVVGVYLLIIYANEGTWAAKILSTKILVGIGLISYSAYLWHQPIFAFTRIRLLDEPSLEIVSFLIVLTLLLAVLSWRFVEQPFRRGDHLGFSRSSIFQMSGIGIAAMIAIGAFGYLSDGLIGRFNSEQREILAFENYKRGPVYREGECFLEPYHTHQDFADTCTNDLGKSFFVWGDSHAAALASGLRQNFPGTSQRTASACPPILDVKVDFPPRPNCEGINRANLQLLISEDKDTPVILHADWKIYAFDIADELRKTVRKLKENGVTNIFLVGGVPLYAPSLPQLLLREGIALDAEHSTTSNQSQVRALDAELAEVARQEGIEFLSPLSHLCEQRDTCLSVIRDDDIFVPTTWDSGHLTLGGASFLTRRLFN